MGAYSVTIDNMKERLEGIVRYHDRGYSDDDETTLYHLTGDVSDLAEAILLLMLEVNDAS